VQDDDCAGLIKSKADELGCFGWVQKRSAVVGEVRCFKHAGEYFYRWFQHKWPTNLFGVYPSTKIKIHFTSFEIIDVSRRICFPEKPNKCESGEQNEVIEDSIIWFKSDPI